MRRAGVLGVLLKAFGVGVVALALGLVASGCGDDIDDAATTDTTAVAAPQDFSGRGPYAVGVVELSLDATRPVLVFYPVDRDGLPGDAEPFAYTPKETWGSLAAAFPPGTLQATPVEEAWRDVPPSAEGPFPVVVHSHARGSNRFFASFHNAHVASWGYVVAVPEHPSRDLMAFFGGATGPWPTDQQTILDTLAMLSNENDRTDGLLHEAIDMDRIAAEGHSAGARTAGVAANDPRIDTWIGLATVAPIPDAATGGRDVVIDSNDGFDPTSGEFDLVAYLAENAPPDKPSMIITDDDIAGLTRDAYRIWDWLPPPKRIVELADTGWNVFMDYCEATQEAGGIQAVADAFNLEGEALADARLTELGCLPSYAPVSDVTALWNHLTVAQLNSVFDLSRDVADASLESDYLDATFPGRIDEYLVEQ